MENQTYPAWKHAMMFAVYISVAEIILSLIFYVADVFAEKWTGIFGYAILLAGIIIAAVQYRNKYLGGFISYGQSVSTGFLAGLFSAIIVAIFSYIFLSYLGEDYIKVIMDKAQENMLQGNPNMTDEQIDMAMKWTRKFMQPGMMAVFAFLGYTVLSLVFALIASIFIKKENQSPEVTV